MTDLDAEQELVVGAPVEARQIVEAGPGCGKTHVACARVARILERKVPPDRLLVLSFTRTAVHEIRTRVNNLTAASAVARNVEVRTLDSFAWRITAGSREIATVASYEDSIITAAVCIDRAGRGESPELQEYLARFKHVLVDEAQDLVGPRALLVTGLLLTLPATCGWTVFLDPAQAIYGWSTDGADREVSQRFVDDLDRLPDHDRRSLSVVHRTTNAGMLDLLARARAAVLDGQRGGRLVHVRQELERHSNGPASPSNIAAFMSAAGERSHDTLVLFRRRADALATTSYLREGGIRSRLRIGSTPRLAAPWFAVLAAWLARKRTALKRIHREDFDIAWAAVCEGRWVAREWSADAAWDVLRRAGASGGSAVDLEEVATRLAMASIPDDAFTRDVGCSGPVIGTVHGSKGREAAMVLFCIPPDARTDSPQESDEEARVLYVGASRAREKLELRIASPLVCGYDEDGRPWHSTRKGFQIEIGRDGDVDPFWHMCMNDGVDADAIQSRLGAFDGIPRCVNVSTDTVSKPWTSRLVLKDGGASIGVLTIGCVRAVQGILRARGVPSKRPLSISYLTWLDISTSAVIPDHPRLDHLRFPWNETRMWLTPVIAGMGMVWRPR